MTTLRAEAGELSHRWPRLSHDGRHLAYTVKSADLVTFDDAALRVMDLRTGDDHEILAGGTFGTLTPSGHLLFARRNRLHAVPLGNDLRPAGPRVEIGAVRMDGASGAASFGLAGDGKLLSLDRVFSRDAQVEILLRDGTRRRLGMPGPWAEPSYRAPGSGPKGSSGWSVRPFK